MQETRYKGETQQTIFEGKSREEILCKMQESLRPSEEVISRRMMTLAEVQEWHGRRPMRRATKPSGGRNERIHRAPTIHQEY